MNNKIYIIGLLALLLMIGMVGSVSAIRFKNAILLDELVFNDFGIRLNDSFEVTGDINVSLVNNTDNGFNYNFFGYSSKNSINVNDVIFYKEDGSSLGYQDAKTNGWIEGINLSTGNIPLGEATTLTEYGGYWVRSFLAVNMTFPNVGGSNTSRTILMDDLLFFNGTDYLNMSEAESASWVDFPKIWDAEPLFGSQNFDALILGDDMPTWDGYIIFTFKPNIYLLFENKTLETTEYEFIAMVNKNGVVIKEYETIVRVDKVNWLIKMLEKIMRVIS